MAEPTSVARYEIPEALYRNPDDFTFHENMPLNAVAYKVALMYQNGLQTEDIIITQNIRRFVFNSVVYQMCAGKSAMKFVTRNEIVAHALRDYLINKHGLNASMDTGSNEVFVSWPDIRANVNDRMLNDR